MQEETKNYLSQLVIDLHYRAKVEEDAKLRIVADEISDLLRKDREECYT